MPRRIFFCFAALFSICCAAQAVDEISARTAWLRELDKAKDPLPILRKGLASQDPEIRAKAVYEYFLRRGDAAVPELEKRIRQAGPAEGMNLVVCAKMVKDPALRTAFLEKIARETTVPEVAREANRNNFPFFRQNVRLSERKDWDFEIVKLKSLPLAGGDWRFLPDNGNVGHLRGFFKTDFPDGKWTRRGPGYWKGNRTAWYRIRFTAPEKPDCNAAELNFTGVEEAAWVWLNGVYIGCRDKGPSAWNQPFQLDVTGEIKWGQENVMAVRVINTGDEGGIYNPVFLDILK
ncbi:MAG: beta galactosidase jelly roll domain-containing protein [Lentisphaeria bacterium]|nr:beta galactosidase jelly roll domain-containing protein [Lentisphaeria bacterium]